MHQSLQRSSTTLHLRPNAISQMNAKKLAKLLAVVSTGMHSLSLLADIIDSLQNSKFKGKLIEKNTSGGVHHRMKS